MSEIIRGKEHTKKHASLLANRLTKNKFYFQLLLNITKDNIQFNYINENNLIFALILKQ